MNLRKIFQLNFKKIVIILWVEALAIILHNAVYAVFGVEEALFFLLAVVVIPLYIVIATLFTAVNFLLNLYKKRNS